MNPYILIFLSACVCFSTTALAQTYTTRFGGEENPLSEGARWRNDGLDWASVRKSHGIAFCTQTGTNTGIHKFDDSYAHLSGFSPDQEAWGESYIAKPDSAYYQELEILLRWTSSPHRTTGYECFARCLNSGASYVQIVRWEGPLGKFTYLAKMAGTNYGLKNGDILKASIVGNVITVFINGVEKAQVTDDTYKTGNPGIGLFLQCEGGHGIGSNTNFGFASFSAEGIGENIEDNERGKLPPSTGLSKLRVSSNHRYLEDASGKPFFLVGDCPQNLPLKLHATEFDAYMAECESKGFNWLWVCIDGQDSGGPPPNPPVDKQGNRMMTNGWSIDTLNDAYFATIDAIPRTAAQHNQYCAFTPLSECQWSQANINRNSADKWRDYGRFLGKRYKDEPNIVWVIGNDNINQTAQHAIVEGMKEAGDTHLMTVNWRPGYHQEGSGWIRKHRFGESWIDLNAWYINAPIRENGAPCYWQKIEFERPDPMPSFQCEAAYQQPDGAKATDLACRMQNYYVALGGGCGGQVYGAGWLADEWDYNSYKNNGGRLQTIHFRDLFTSRNWTSLVPDYKHAFITEGYGTLSTNTTDYVGAALNSGTLGLAYCPKSATITADLSKLSGPVKARWYDPTNGKFREIAGSPFPNSGSHGFSTPGKNSTGEDDWVLLLEAMP